MMLTELPAPTQTFPDGYLPVRLRLARGVRHLHAKDIVVGAHSVTATLDTGDTVTWALADMIELSIGVRS